MTEALSITIYVMSIVIGLYGLPFVVREFGDSPIVDLIIRRGCWIIATFLLMLAGAIMATLSDSASLGVTQEMFRFMWLAGSAGWIMMLWLVWGTLKAIIREMGDERRKRRMGED